MGQDNPYPQRTVWSRLQYRNLAISIISLLVVFQLTIGLTHLYPSQSSTLPSNYISILEKCNSLHLSAGPPPDFHQRPSSDHYVPGTNPTLIKNATIWTGRFNGLEVVHGDVLLHNGIIMSIGKLGTSALIEAYGRDLDVLDAKGRWLTPGIVDLHSHMGVESVPILEGAQDGSSLKGLTLPWLRAIDALNTHDESYQLSIAGGLTTALVLPGSADAIGGQAFVIKLRKTTERSTSSMILEPPYQINSSVPWDSSLPPRWRHIKHACGENPSRVYSGTRMDTMWAFRKAYNKASQLKSQQDAYCAKAQTGHFAGLGDFPEDLQWEALVDVLRGRVKVNTHCYEAVDLDAFVRLTNEFKFPVAAFHHASETYLVPEVLKRAYGGAPASAIFSGFGRYKREAYRFSEFAAKILNDNGLTVVMKSDHPSAINSRYLLHEAQQAYYHGLPENVAIAAVTSNPAEVMGMGHRIGYIKKGWDADLVLWDTHPLSLGSTPIQVFIDGIPQLVPAASRSTVENKAPELQRPPRIGNFDKEARDVVKYDGLPPLEVSKASSDTVVFVNVSEVVMRMEATEAGVGGVMEVFRAERNDVGTSMGTVVARNGKFVCWGLGQTCESSSLNSSAEEKPVIIDLEGGSISPALVAYGAPLGLTHISFEPLTSDEPIFDPLHEVPRILGGETSVIRAVDGIQYGARDALLAYRAGVTTAITAPIHEGFFFGLGTCLSTGASHKLERGALVQEISALHTSIRFSDSTGASVSTIIGTLRRALLGAIKDEDKKGLLGSSVFNDVVGGHMPLVVEVDNADAIASLISLKREIEEVHGTPIAITIAGAGESHLLAKEIAEAGIGVIVAPTHPFPSLWETRRALPGPPLTSDTTITVLLEHNVTVGIGLALPGFGPPQNWNAQNLRLVAAWAALDSGGRISKQQAIEMVSVNVEKLLGVKVAPEESELVATRGGDLFHPGARPVAVVSPRRERVDLLA